MRFTPLRLPATGFACLIALALFMPLHAQGADGAKETEPTAPAQKLQQLPAPTKKLDAEISQLTEKIKAAPADATLHAQLGYLLLKKGDADEAKRAFDTALQLNPRSHAAMTGEGIVLARKGSLKEAEQTLKDALAQNPNPVRTHYELGQVYEKLGDFEKAAAEYKEGIRKFEQGRH
jgi:tetratricopeptide (TPR) repeat protein